MLCSWCCCRFSKKQKGDTMFWICEDCKEQVRDIKEHIKTTNHKHFASSLMCSNGV